ncbi:hypothetical protein ASPCAL09275 [Aspergillus calidoustus]|uniref:Uncharacterized protein n=1 Tax=Aspergillus calidoustus TaxID=454130 RepID=A0A0U5GYL5_ASPCI|nr:hypothetical protein ASPCAL09275 [Aspergillus calidoustus]
MDSQNLRMHEDQDVQLAKEILTRFDENDRAHANNQTTTHEPDAGLNGDSIPDSDRPSDIRLFLEGVGDDDQDDDNEDDSDEEDTVERGYSHFEWGVDEPEFEGYPEFSDDEAGYDDQDDSGHDDDGEDGAN